MPDEKLLRNLSTSTNITGIPSLIINETGLLIWCMNSHPFVSPTVSVDILLLNSVPRLGRRDIALMNLLNYLIQEKLNRDLAAAADAGNWFAFDSNQILVGGYDLKVVEHILNEILKTLRTFKIDANAFQTKKLLLSQKYDAVNFLLPFEIGMSDIWTLLVNPAWSENELKSELSNVTSTELQNFIDHGLLNDFVIRSFIFGHYDCNQGEQIGRLIKSALEWNFKPKQELLTIVFLRIICVASSAKAACA